MGKQDIFLLLTLIQWVNQKDVEDSSLPNEYADMLRKGY